MSLEEAIAIAVESNPEIGQAIENREAVEFELRQARGLYLPSVDLEAAAGTRRLSNQSRRALDIANDTLNSAEIGLTVTQTLFDNGARRAEVEAQAARVDSASFRVLERSELIGLAVVQDYLEYMLQASIVEATRSNLAFHQSILGDIGEGISGGALTEADRQQAQERLLAATARQQEAVSELDQAKIRFFKTVGVPLTKPKKPRSVAGSLPSTLDAALGLARQNNPRVRSSSADIDAAQAGVAGARAKYGPTVLLEGKARTGHRQGKPDDGAARCGTGQNTLSGNLDTSVVNDNATDIFVIDAGKLAGLDLFDIITDFQSTGANADVLDLSDMLESLLGNAPTDAAAANGVVNLTVGAGFTSVMVDDNGTAAGGTMIEVARLTGTHTAINILYDDTHDTTSVA